MLQMYLKPLHFKEHFKSTSKKKKKKTVYLIGNKIANRITKVSKTSPKNDLEIVTN